MKNRKNRMFSWVKGFPLLLPLLFSSQCEQRDVTTEKSGTAVKSGNVADGNQSSGVAETATIKIVFKTVEEVLKAAEEAAVNKKVKQAFSKAAAEAKALKVAGVEEGIKAEVEKAFKAKEKAAKAAKVEEGVEQAFKAAAEAFKAAETVLKAMVKLKEEADVVFKTAREAFKAAAEAKEAKALKAAEVIIAEATVQATVATAFKAAVAAAEAAAEAAEAAFKAAEEEEEEEEEELVKWCEGKRIEMRST